MVVLYEFRAGVTEDTELTYYMNLKQVLPKIQNSLKSFIGKEIKNVIVQLNFGVSSQKGKQRNKLSQRGNSLLKEAVLLDFPNAKGINSLKKSDTMCKNFLRSVLLKQSFRVTPRKESWIPDLF